MKSSILLVIASILNSHALCELRLSHQEISERGLVPGCVWVADEFRMQFLPSPEHYATLECDKLELVLRHATKPSFIKIAKIGNRDHLDAASNSTQNRVTFYSSIGLLMGTSSESKTNGFHFREQKLQMTHATQAFEIIFKADTQNYDEMVFAFNCFLNSLRFF